MPQQKKTWVLVCDAGRAQLFEQASPARHYQPVAAFVHEQSRAHVVDLVTDAQGRKPVVDVKQVEAQKFARQLAAVLSRGLDEHAYEALVLVAPPKFLGLLKGSLGEQVRRRLEVTIERDLAQLAPREVERRLRAERAA
jgi:protein required for attachment to host cells